MDLLYVLEELQDRAEKRLAVIEILEEKVKKKDKYISRLELELSIMRDYA